jgi:hypothetical protein
MAAHTSRVTYDRIPAELPEPLSRIFSAHVTIPKTPLPAVITEAMCTGRQLYEWSFNYGWAEILANHENRANENHEEFMRKMATRINRWRDRNMISRMTPQSGAVQERIIVDLRQNHSDTELFFGVIGQLDLSNFTYTTAYDQDQAQKYDPRFSYSSVYSLPTPRDVPAYFRQRTGIQSFQAWLRGNRPIFQNYFPAAYNAWLPHAPPNQAMVPTVTTTAPAQPAMAPALPTTASTQPTTVPTHLTMAPAQPRITFAPTKKAVSSK